MGQSGGEQSGGARACVPADVVPGSWEVGPVWAGAADAANASKYAEFRVCAQSRRLRSVRTPAAHHKNQNSKAVEKLQQVAHKYRYTVQDS